MRRILPLLLCLTLPACAREGRPSAEAVAAPSADTARLVRYEEEGYRPPAVVTIPYTMVLHPRTRVVMPRLTNPATPQARAVDTRLESMAAEMSCGGEEEADGQKTWFEYSAGVSYASDSVFSVRRRDSYYCGGGSLTNGVNFSVTFDLRTGQEVEWKELWADWTRDGESIMRAIFPAQTAHADSMAAQLGEGEPDRDSGDPCWDLFLAEELASGSHLRYSVADSGLAVELDPPQVIKSCGEQAVVPYERLRPFAGGILARVANRQRARR